MSETTHRLLQDLQASVPDVPIGLSRAGVTGVQKAVLIGRGSPPSGFAILAIE